MVCSSVLRGFTSLSIMGCRCHCCCRWLPTAVPTTFRAEPLSFKPRAYLYHNFISNAEADHIIKMARPFVRHPRLGLNAAASATQGLGRLSQRCCYCSRPANPPSPP